MYVCKDCFACLDESGGNAHVCEFDKTSSELPKPLTFDVHTKTPCDRFIPADYIESLNYDSVTR
jgi:hypothetical protein